jgi:hypothetical protein
VRIAATQPVNKKQKKAMAKPWVDAGAKERQLSAGELRAIRQWLRDTDDQLRRHEIAERETR